MNVLVFNPGSASLKVAARKVLEWIDACHGGNAGRAI
jgi:hypothetical protein